MDGQRTVDATLETLAEAVEQEGDRGAGADRRRPGRRATRVARLARAPPAARPRVVVTRARAQASAPRRHAARARRRGRSSCRRSGSSRALDGEDVRGGDRRDRRLLAGLPDQPQRRPAALRGAGAGGLDARAAGRRHRRRDRPGHRGGARRSGESSPTSSRALRRRGAGRGAGRRSTSRAAASSSPAPPPPATCSPTRCASAAPRSTSSPSMRRCARTPTPRRSRPRGSADYVTFTSSSTVRNLTEALGDELPRRRPHRLDRPDHQRGGARGRPRGRGRGRPPRRRRPGRGPARGCRSRSTV